MRRIGLAVVLTLSLLPALAAESQPAKVPRIGVLAGSFPNDEPCLEPLRRGLFPCPKGLHKSTYRRLLRRHDRIEFSRGS